jgi:hypothetical protein
VTSTDLIRTARSYQGQREWAPNSSPLINRWLASVGQPPGEPWCAAFACACVYDTDPTIGFLRSASALKLLARNPDRVISDPEVGALVIWDHGHGKGHVAIITAIDGQTFSAIAGNTSEDGKSREGIMVAEHDGFQVNDPTIAGFLRVCA